VEVILGGEDTMPAFVDVLTDQEIADVLAWLKS
jgi:mono/diheme cytochrome c family protein